MRVALFFDGKNFFRSMENTDPSFEVSYDRLAEWIVRTVAGSDGAFAGAYYYTGHNAGGGGDRGAAFGRFLAGLSYRKGFFVRREPRVRRRSRAGGKTRYYWTEKRVDTRLVAEMIQLAAVDAYDVAVLFSGDQDLVPAVEAVGSLGKQVWLAHWARGGVSKELRRRCFYEIDLTSGLAEIGTGKARPRATVVAAVAATVDEAGGEAAIVVDAPAGDTEPTVEAVAEAIARGHAHFTESGGHLSEWFFINRWRADHPCPPATSAEREAAVLGLVEIGRVEVYEYEDAKGRATRALRPAE